MNADKEAALATAQQQLTEVRAAISAVLTGGQTVQYNGRGVSRADLKTLQDAEKILMGRVRRLSRTAGQISVNRVIPT